MVKRRDRVWIFNFSGRKEGEENYAKIQVEIRV